MVYFPNSMAQIVRFLWRRDLLVILVFFGKEMSQYQDQ